MILPDTKIQPLKDCKKPNHEDKEEQYIYCDGGLHNGCMESLKDGNLTLISTTWTMKGQSMIVRKYACDRHLDDFITIDLNKN